VSRTAISTPDDSCRAYHASAHPPASHRPGCNYGRQLLAHGAHHWLEHLADSHYPAAHRRPADVHAGLAQQNRALASISIVPYGRYQRASGDCAAHWCTRKRGRSRDRSPDGRAPNRTIHKSPAHIRGSRGQVNPRRWPKSEHRPIPCPTPSAGAPVWPYRSPVHFDPASVGQPHHQPAAGLVRRAPARCPYLYRQQPIGDAHWGVHGKSEPTWKESAR
jgi:hypothetical protein